MNLEKIKNKFHNYFKVWWIPIVSYLIPFSIFFLGQLTRKDSIIDIFLWTFYLNILGNIISSIVQIFIKKWYLLFPQIIITVLLFLYVSIVFIFSPPDYYGVGKIIPDNIEIYKPKETKPSDDELIKFDLVIVSSHQPGIYSYYTDFKPIEKGSFYIKVFEVTSNDHLSEERIRSTSKINVKNLNQELFKGEFTVYEGSWGDKYGARIELWFKPLSNEKQDYKITERNYIIEGWMR